VLVYKLPSEGSKPILLGEPSHLVVYVLRLLQIELSITPLLPLRVVVLFEPLSVHLYLVPQLYLLVCHCYCSLLKGTDKVQSFIPHRQNLRILFLP